jgi:DNA invertase Pin-like site-specific DNA recombinase
MANVGYIRVSTVDQNTVRQLDGIELIKYLQSIRAERIKIESS